MLKYSKPLGLVVFVFLFAMCNQKSKNETEKETILKGSLDLAVDETVKQIVDDQVAVFEGTYYDAKIKVKPESEAEVINDLLNQKAKVAITTRDLTVEEKARFDKSKINPRVTPFAHDAIAFISSKSNNDTLIALKTVIDFMQGKTDGKIKGLVFSFKTNNEVIKFVSENEGMIGVIGINWFYQPTPDMTETINKINVLYVKGLNSNEYYSPTQNDLEIGKYPLARDLFIINCQGYSGLGMGFASFIAGDIGQRIVLKSGLLPYKTPGRKLKIRNEIIKDKE
jgi:phosphate transport system substrate-binding protein